MRLLLALALALAGCPAPEPAHPELAEGGRPPADSPDAEDPPEGSAAIPACSRACAALERLGCPEAERPDGGRTCYAVCADAERGGKFSLKPSCVAASKSVAELRACGTVRCGK